MRHRIITLREYEEKKIDRGVFSNRELIELERLNIGLRKKYRIGRDVVSVSSGVSTIRLRANSFVGVLQIGKKTIQIIPKMSRAKNEDEYNEQAISNLLHMLAVTKKLSVSEADSAGLRKVKDNFFEILIFLFAKNLLELIKNEMNREYENHEENLPYLKGKLHFSSHIKTNVFRRSHFYLQFDEFTENSLLNKIFKYTVQRLLGVSQNVNNIKILQQLSFIFSEVDYCDISSEDFKRVHLNRLNKKYESVLNLAQMFVCQGSIEMKASDFSTYTFIFDMSVLFEEYIGEIIRRNFKQDFVLIKLQGPRKYLTQEGKFMMYPDISLYKNNEAPEIIIDTKYKDRREDSNDSKNGVSQSDMYQMYAYAKKYSCPRIILLYPYIYNSENSVGDYHFDQVSKVEIRTVNLGIDLKRDYMQLIKDLKGILLV